MLSSGRQLDRKIVIVDVGCRGGFAEKFITGKACFRVYGFEPDRAECERMKACYPGLDVTLIPAGLAGRSGPRTLYVTQDPACSSLLEPDPRLTTCYPALACARQVSTTRVETITLDQWAESCGVREIDYLKIDTQGTELEILQGGIRSLCAVRALEVEVEFNPIYRGQPVFADVDSFLRREGFVLWRLSNQVHYSRGGAPALLSENDSVFYDDRQRVTHEAYGGQLYWANAFYVKKCLVERGDDDPAQVERDQVLLQALGRLDVMSQARALPEEVE